MALEEAAGLPQATDGPALRRGGIGGSAPDDPDVARQPSARRGQPGGDAAPAAALTGPPTVALPGVPLRPSEREPSPHGDTACRAPAAWHEAERQPGGDGVAAAALTHSRLPRCQRPATDPRRRPSEPICVPQCQARRSHRCWRPAA